MNPETTYYADSMCWDWRAAEQVLEAWPQVVAAVITGHDHFGRSATSASGIYHRVLEAAMEGEPGVATHAVLELQGDRVELQGRGAVQSWQTRLSSAKKASEL
mmetsp:Transcript_61621/g.102270  ORF Transcript_61621/g.102270 Transcript_61621/m.102270 type:complete len:103 (+) Transcript_61621:1-309(+)